MKPMKCTLRLQMWALKLILLMFYRLQPTHMSGRSGKLFRSPFALVFMLYLIYFETNFPHWWIIFLGDYDNVFSPVMPASLCSGWLIRWLNIADINSALSTDCASWLPISTILNGFWPCAENLGRRDSDWSFEAVSFFFSRESENDKSHKKESKAWLIPMIFFLHPPTPHT